jgi:hypothetical protein
MGGSRYGYMKMVIEGSSFDADSYRCVLSLEILLQL